MDLSKIKEGDTITVKVKVIKDSDGRRAIPAYLDPMVGGYVDPKWNIRPEEILSVVSPIRVGDVFRSKTSKFEHTVLYVDDEHALTSYEVDNGFTKLVWSLDDMDQRLERIKSDG